RPHRTLLRLVYSSGLRMGETLSPPPADIKKDKGLIYIQGGKESKDRRVPPSSQYLTELRKFYIAYKPKQYLFEGQQGGRYLYGDLNIKGKTMVHYLPNE